MEEELKGRDTVEESEEPAARKRRKTATRTVEGIAI